MKKHQKHTKLTRPNFGQFNRQEWAILGTNCGAIQKLSRIVIDELSDQYNLGYVDAEHKNHDESDPANLPKTVTTYTDMIDYHRFDTFNEFNEFQYRDWFSQQDAVLINGNHFKGKKQVVVIDQKKKESLSRKLDRLTDVQAIIFADRETAIYDFLKENIENWEHIPHFQLSQTKEITEWFAAEMVKGTTALRGLVLAGGKSQRMGTDKSAINYHGVSQTEHVHQLLSKHCKEVFLSCRPDQMDQFNDYKIIPDTFTGLGPFGAILSAFRENPNIAWLVMAVDLPLADSAFLTELVSKRNPSKQATAFLNPATGFPDPLLTIWEPRSYATLLQFLAQGYSCPRKTLINSNIELIETPHPEKLSNANTPEEYQTILKTING